MRTNCGQSEIKHVLALMLLSLCYKRIGSCLACVYRVMDARGKFGEHERSVRVARGAAESNSSFNRPFYSCVLSYLAMNASEAGGDLALIQSSQLFSCKCKLVSIKTP